MTNLDRMKVIGLSATPELLIDYVDSISFGNIARELPANYQAKRVEVIQHSSVITYLKSLEYSADNKVLVYLQAAKDCAKLAKEYPNAGFLVSNYNEDTLESEGKKLNEMMMNQKVNEWHANEDNLRDYVLNNERLPNGYDLLFFNDANLVGVNIKDKAVRHVICETVDQSSIVQSIGRVRHNLETITVITNKRNKKTFLMNYERAREFFSDENIDLYT